MAEDEHPKNQVRQKRTRKRIWQVTVLTALALIALVFAWSICSSRSLTPEERLAAIQAELAVPDEQNAALIYDQLLEDHDEADFRFNSADPNTDILTSREPWLSKDHPELAQWLADRQDVIDALIKASKKEKCLFTVDFNPAMYEYGSMAPVTATQRWSYLLVSAANNDLAEGRTRQALAKWTATRRMAQHVYQQPFLSDLILAAGVEFRVLKNMRRFVVEDPAAQGQLDLIEEELQSVEGSSAPDWAMIRQLENIQENLRDIGFFQRLQLRFRHANTFKDAKRLWQRMLAERCATRIMIALRRYRDKHGAWPESLEQVRSYLPAEALIDPQNNGTFVYQCTGDTFRLYSKGSNGVDENGEYNFDMEDRTGSDDRVYWRMRSRSNRKEDTNDDK